MRYLIFAFLGTLSISGCATIIDGTTQNITFNSQPNGVKIFVNGAQIGVTPLTTQIKRSKDTIILAQKAGYQDQQIQLQTKLNTYFWGNIICGGVYGSTTDYASGAITEYSPSMYYVTLETKENPIYSRTQDVPLDGDKKVRGFIIRNFEEIAKDIAKGDGEYLTALYSMLDVPEAEYKLMLKKLTVIAADNHDAPPFASKVLEQFPAKAGVAIP